ncbi:hypothetical protein CABS03_14726 [Colletotrichum abscissum]|uniref:Uncharacterized protein n=1 Tax=Colletotrichum abscissum TaxID=1671311 RepID=A0A9P9XQM4_9PEZI|nr:hypothetical protein CABS02_02206 [Colletotrichum abscissum]
MRLCCDLNHYVEDMYISWQALSQGPLAPRDFDCTHLHIAALATPDELAS